MMGRMQFMLICKHNNSLACYAEDTDRKDNLPLHFSLNLNDNNVGNYAK